jgi:hypothetical protein
MMIYFEVPESIEGIESTSKVITVNVSEEILGIRHIRCEKAEHVSSKGGTHVEAAVTP